MLKRHLANAVQRVVERLGYTVARPSFHRENPIDLRGLLAAIIERQTGRPLRVIQIGANDGITGDPIHDNVVNRGWELLAVEPLPRAFARLRQTYASCPRVRLLQAAVGERSGESTLYHLRPVEGRESDDQLASFDVHVLRRHWRRVPDLRRRLQTTTVPCLTPGDLVSRAGYDRIDLLQVDTEGFDWQIVRMAFEGGLRPPILAFEWVHLPRPQMWDCRCRLIDLGYRWLLDRGDVIAFRDPA